MHRPPLLKLTKALCSSKQFKFELAQLEECQVLLESVVFFTTLFLWSAVSIPAVTVYDHQVETETAGTDH